MSAQQTRRYTPDEYLEIERSADYKSEYIAGEIFAMSGASNEHNLIVTNTINRLGKRLRHSPCGVLGSNMRIQTGEGAFLYSDVMVVCDEAQFRPDAYGDTLLNPRIVIEVLSSSTEANDRGEKFHQYRHTKSVQEYLIVSQTQASVEQFSRQGSVWLMREFKDGGDVIHLPMINCSLPLAEVYEGVTFAEESIRRARDARE